MSKSHIPKYPNRLREFRKKQGLTLKKVGELTGIAFTNIGKIETGERDLKSWHMAKFSQVYGVPCADLFNEIDGGLISSERLLIETYRDVSPSLRAVIDAMIESMQALRGVRDLT